MNWIFIPLLFFIQLAFSIGHADQLKCKILFPLEVANEIELDRSWSVSLLLRPINNDLFSALPEADRLEFYKKHFSELSIIDWKKIDWLNLSFAQKDEVLGIIGKYVDFNIDRKIPGFEFKRNFLFKPSKNFKFKDTEYKANITQEIDLTGFLIPTAEYAMSWAVKNAGSVEMHFRDKNPNLIDENIRIFYNYILPYIEGLPSGVEKDYGLIIHSAHTHIPANRPSNFISDSLKKGYSKNDIAEGMTLHHTTIELMMLLQNAILGEKNAIQEVAYYQNKPPTLSFLTADKETDLKLFYQKLVDDKLDTIDKSTDEWSTLKKNNVGARSGNTYSDTSLWGLEFRYLFGYQRSNHYSKIASKVKKNIDDQNFEKFVTLNKKYKTHFQNLMLDKDPQQMVNRIIDPDLKSAAQRFIEKYKDLLVNKNRTTTYFSPYFLLLIDWSNHPLISENQKYSEFIKRMQIKFLEEANDDNVKNESSTHSKPIKSFIEKTGLLNYLVTHL